MRLKAGVMIGVVLALGLVDALDAAGTGHPPGVRSRSPKLLADGVMAFAVSPNGREAALFVRSGLVRLSLDTGRQSVIVLMPPVDLTNLQSALLSWSPDGRKLALATNLLNNGRGPREFHMDGWLMVFRQGMVQPVVLDQACEVKGASWSPDSSRLCWTRMELVDSLHFATSLVLARIGSGAVHPRAIYRPDGGDGDSRFANWPAWTRDGARIITQVSNCRDSSRPHEIRTIGAGGKLVRSAVLHRGQGVLLTCSSQSHGRGSVACIAAGDLLKYDSSTGKAYQISRICDARLTDWCWGDRALAVLCAAGSGMETRPGAPAFRRSPPYSLSIIALDGRRLAGPFRISEPVTDLQCAANRRLLYTSEGRLYMLSY